MINKPQPQKPSSKESDLINMLSQQVTLAPIPVILSMSTIAIMAAETVPTHLKSFIKSTIKNVTEIKN